MNILWKVENVIINFYIRKWGRNIKQTALNIERGPHVKRIVSGIMGSLPGQKRWDEKRDDNQTSRVILLLCRDGKVEQPKKMRPRRTALWVFRGSSKVKSHHHLFIYWSGLSPPLVLFLLMYCVQNKSQQNGLCSVCLVLTLPCICSNFMCRRGERGARQLCLKYPGYTQPHGDKGHWIHQLAYTTLTLHATIVCACSTNTGSAEEVCSFLKNVGTDAAEGFPQCSLSSSHLLLTFFRIYITVSGPACTLLCTSVKSGEVYKKCVEKLIPSGQAKLEIKRYCSFSLGWHSSKGGEMDYKYRYRSWHFYSIP